MLRIISIFLIRRYFSTLCRHASECVCRITFTSANARQMQFILLIFLVIINWGCSLSVGLEPSAAKVLCRSLVFFCSGLLCSDRLTVFYLDNIWLREKNLPELDEHWCREYYLQNSQLSSHETESLYRQTNIPNMFGLVTGQWNLVLFEQFLIQMLHDRPEHLNHHSIPRIYQWSIKCYFP